MMNDRYKKYLVEEQQIEQYSTHEFDNLDLDNIQLTDEELEMLDKAEDEPEYETAPDTVEPGDIHGAYLQCIEEIQTSINQFLRFTSEWCSSEDNTRCKQEVDNIEKINNILFSVVYGDYGI